MTVRTIGSTRIGPAHALGVTAEQVGRLMDAEWNRRIALSLPEFYRWQFADAPAAAGLDHSVVAVEGDGTLVGFLGLTPRPAVVDGTVRAGAELTTWVLAERVKARGLALPMLEHVQANYDLTCGTGISEAALPVFTAAGFRYHRYLPRFVRILDAAKVSEFAPLAPRVRRQLPPPVDAPAGVRATAVPAAALADLAAATLARFGGFARDAAALGWRYDTHPHFRYEAFALDVHGTPAGVVVRLDAVSALPVLQVVEVHGAVSALPAVAAWLEGLARERGAAIADLSVTTDRIGGAFRAQGWHSMTDESWVQVPHLFHPVELRTPATTSLMLWSRTDPVAVLTPSGLYVTKGDVDLDRPTMQYLESAGR